MSTPGIRLMVAAAFVSFVTVLGALGGSSAQAAGGPHLTPRFECGPNALTYDVFTLGGEQADGVRCLTPLGATWGSRELIWYGEGRWDGQAYRHLGAAYAQIDRSPNQYHGYAADFYGNGEEFSGSTQDLTLRVVEGALPKPVKIELRGAWNEDWQLQGEVFVLAPLYEPLPRPTTCGPNFDEYKVTTASGAAAVGLRCVLQSDMVPGTTWFGNGQWGNKTYTHVGVRSAYDNKAQAWDLCNATYGDFCGQTPSGALTVAQVPGGYDATGAWNEKWRK